MKTSRFYLILPVLSITSCVDPMFAGGGGYGNSFNSYSTLPRNYNGSAYYHNNRYYSGGQYQTGAYNHQGHSYNNRYYHNGQYYYGGDYQHHGASALQQYNSYNQNLRVNTPALPQPSYSPFQSFLQGRQ